jgi:catechol 2,3-dioxygenase-like lactoylglutathione lyase family enzyme
MPSSFDAAITFCRTTDLARAAAFYEETLGLPLVLDQGVCRIYRVAGGGFVGFCEHLEGDAAEGVILTLVTDDVDGWHQRLVERGVAIETPPTHNPRFGIYHLFLRDPDGHRVEIQRFDDADWAKGDGS